MEIKTKIPIIPILTFSAGLILALALSYIFRGKSPAEKALQKQVDQLNKDIKQTERVIKEKEILLVERDRQIAIFDSLRLEDEKTDYEREIQFAREREQLRKQLRQMTKQQKEDYLTKRYETPTN